MLNSEDVPAESTQITEFSDDVTPFLTTYEITPGDMPVSKKLLYKLYKTYSKAPIEQAHFNLKVGEYIADKSDKYYYINKDNFAISKHIYQQEKKIDKTKRLTSQKHFQWVMETMPITKGGFWLEGFIIFYLYKIHCKSHRISAKLGYKSFHNFLKLHFQYKRLSENRSLWFKVDEALYNRLTEEEKEVIRGARKKEGRSKKESTDSTNPTPQS